MQKYKVIYYQEDEPIFGIDLYAENADRAKELADTIFRLDTLRMSEYRRVAFQLDTE